MSRWIRQTAERLAPGELLEIEARDGLALADEIPLAEQTIADNE